MSSSGTSKARISVSASIAPWARKMGYSGLAGFGFHPGYVSCIRSTARATRLSGVTLKGGSMRLAIAGHFDPDGLREIPQFAHADRQGRPWHPPMRSGAQLAFAHATLPKSLVWQPEFGPINEIPGARGEHHGDALGDLRVRTLLHEREPVRAGWPERPRKTRCCEHHQSPQCGIFQAIIQGWPVSSKAMRHISPTAGSSLPAGLGHDASPKLSVPPSSVLMAATIACWDVPPG